MDYSTQHKLKILHILKTSDGARWALHQIESLLQINQNDNPSLEIHLILPKSQGRFIEEWKKLNITIHFCDCDFSLKSILRIPTKVSKLTKIIMQIQPDIIHSHFFSTTILCRIQRFFHKETAKIPLIFQVPGPLHLENYFFSLIDILSAQLNPHQKRNDFWICSSRYIKNLYLGHGVYHRMLFLSYYGNKQVPKDSLREKTNDSFLIGNINYFYPPKRYLLQRTGVKNHELLIDVIKSAHKKDPSIVGKLYGKQWGEADNYENKLKTLAQDSAGVELPGFADGDVYKRWQSFDLGIHLPKSENCGGILEAIEAGIPVLVNNCGGLPEIVIDGKTGTVVESSDPDDIAREIVKIKNNYNQVLGMSKKAKQLVTTMFDVKRTSKEIYQVYLSINAHQPRPEEFNSREFIENLEQP